MSNVSLPFSQYRHCKDALDDVSAIAYFLAKEVVAKYALKYQLQQNEATTLFYVTLATVQHFEQGHSCLPINILKTLTFGRVQDDTYTLVYDMSKCGGLDKLVSLVCQGEDSLIVHDYDALYLRKNRQFEVELSEYFSQRMYSRLPVDVSAAGPLIASLFDYDNQHIDWQVAAVANTLNKGLSVIAGGPGTGKTYTVARLLAVIAALRENANLSTTISLVAPTGKAAQRLSESIAGAKKSLSKQVTRTVLQTIPETANTIHRLLGVIPGKHHFKNDSENKLALDVLLVDEVSMVDLPLMTRLFRALPEHCQVILLGDADQLPSVAVGNVLADIAQRPFSGYSQDNLAYLDQCKVFDDVSALIKTGNQNHLTFLQKSRRFDGEGGIGVLAKAVISSDTEQSWQCLQGQQQDVSLLSGEITSWLPKLINRYYKPLAQSDTIEAAFEALKQFSILSATNEGETGVNAINQLVIQALSPASIDNQQPYFHGMPVMIQENNQALGLFNGDIGIIWQRENGKLYCGFEDSLTNTIKWYVTAKLPQNKPVYAMTIHKSQGSEFNHVVMVLPNNNDSKLLSRELLYTAITRAKQQISVYADQTTWQHAVGNRVVRYSNLDKRLATLPLNE
ncbi:exodeoxyribonuclease V subunit alpha [Thalassotalea agarivorans]|uniref:RecBCD enzyme subunit RecD n=1 Tax=Thalassotalea agarivorans TaxID=349064 RepID=A0A1I0EWB6_THASX|nr:exodeoxyribonuclease V subunit alpha [Thalassotalea agarivorans]SET49784.1 DNA helicase/exodeoxyribonuclease V, alpha subunit [Thalassotalea agarivorans]